MKDNKGITITILVITVIILLIIAGITVTVSKKQIDNIKLEDFFRKLEIAQERSWENL